MNTINQNYEIKETDKENGVLKEESKNNFEASFAKVIFDVMKEGYSLKLADYVCKESVITIEEEIEVEDEETGKIIKVKQKVNKDAYSCTCKIQLLNKKSVDGKIKSLTNREQQIELKNNKIALGFNSSKLPCINNAKVGE